jgi:hypothetical protein
MKINTSVELQLLVNGRPVTTYGRDGRTFVEGREGTEFSLRVRNNTAGRVEAVVSVDGRSVVDGEPAKPSSTGYIIPAYGSYEIPGWRMNAEACAKFIFNKPGESYATKSGSPVADVGVIGLMAWAEKALPLINPPPVTIINQPVQPWYVPGPYIYNPGPTCDLNSTCNLNYTPPGVASVSSASNTTNVVTAYSCCFTDMRSAAPAVAAPEFKLGTGWGGSVQDAITYTSFVRGELLTEREIYYSDAAALRAVGIEMDKPVALPTAGSTYPSAFKFCRPPT